MIVYEGTINVLAGIVFAAAAGWTRRIVLTVALPRASHIADTGTCPSAYAEEAYSENDKSKHDCSRHESKRESTTRGPPHL
jgi:hypothetical protein